MYYWTEMNALNFWSKHHSRITYAGTITVQAEVHCTQHRVELDLLVSYWHWRTTGSGNGGWRDVNEILRSKT